MIALFVALSLSPVHASRVLRQFFDLRQPACASFLNSTRLKMPRLKFHTPRLTFRHARETDRAAARVFLSDAEITRWYFNDPNSNGRDIDRYFAKLRDGVRVHYSPRLDWVRAMRFVLVERGRTRPIGAAMIQRGETSGRWEIGYALAPEMRGRGLGVEMIEGLCAMVARVEATAMVEAHPSSRNAKSRYLLNKAGFERRDEAPTETEAPRSLIYERSVVSRGLSPEESRPSVAPYPL